MRALEERLGVRLLTRTTRSVAPTEAGEKLVATVGPHLEEIEAGLTALSQLRDKPAGTIRITTVDHAAETILWPALSNFLAEYPDVSVDLIVDNTLRDIVSERFDGHWRDQPAELFSKVKRSMPQDDPGSLTVAQATDVVAAILHANGVQPTATDTP